MLVGAVSEVGQAMLRQISLPHRLECASLNWALERLTSVHALQERRV